MVRYTELDKTQKKYTVEDAVKAATTRLGNKGVCMNAVCKRSLTDKITLVELNDLADLIVSDSNYYEYRVL